MKYRTDYPQFEGKDIVLDNLESFYRFIYERQKVWYNRFVLRLPREEWTDNEILQRSKYTNVYRELDRGTIWWFKNIADMWDSREENMEELSLDALKLDIVWRTCVYRLLNKQETFDEVGIPGFEDWDSSKKAWFAHLQKLLDDGVKVWTSAHITLQSNFKMSRLENLKMILGYLEGNVQETTEDILASDSMEDSFKRLRKNYGFGPFISYEVLTDLAYLDFTKFDNDTWANPGPGCQPGIKLIFPFAKTGEDFQYLMKLLRDKQREFFAHYEIPFEEVMYKDYLTLRGIEHSLCEWRKYWNEENKVGRPRPKYYQKSGNTLYKGASIRS